MDTNRLPAVKRDPDDDGAETLGICRTCRFGFKYSARFEKYGRDPLAGLEDSWKGQADRERKYIVLCQHPVMANVTEGGEKYPRHLDDPVVSCDGHTPKTPA